MAVLSRLESKTVKVYYKAPQSGNVRITIRDSQKKMVFSEMVKATSGFMRPYNFDSLPEGEYTIQVDDAFGKQIENLSYHMGKSTKLVHLAKVAGQETKYVLTGRALKPENIVVRIYDGSNQVVFEESREVNGEFGEIYNLKKLSGSFTIEVTDSFGELTSIHNLSER